MLSKNRYISNIHIPVRSRDLIDSGNSNFSFFISKVYKSFMFKQRESDILIHKKLYAIKIKEEAK